MPTKIYREISQRFTILLPLRYNWSSCRFKGLLIASLAGKSLGNFLSGMGIDEIFDKEFLYLNCSHFEIPRALERSAGLAKSSKFRLNEQESALSGINFWSRAQSLYYKRPTPRTYRIQLDAPSNEKARAGRSSGFPSPLPNIPIAPLRKIRSDRIRR